MSGREVRIGNASQSTACYSDPQARGERSEGSSRLQIKGEVHHDRRLHQLMLCEASREWASQAGKKKAAVAPSPSPSIKVDERDSVECRSSIDSHARAVASSPTDSVSSLHDTLHHANTDFRWALLLERYRPQARCLYLWLIMGPGKFISGSI